MPSQPLYGLMAEFTSAAELLAATQAAVQLGYRKLDAYSPQPVEGLDDALHFRPRILPWLVFLGGLGGGTGAYFMQYYASVHGYPLLVAGRPLHSWPAFIPITFELTILAAALTALLVLLIGSHLPQPYHPVFNVEEFERASQDRFFLCIESSDPRFVIGETRQFLESFSPVAVHTVKPQERPAMCAMSQQPTQQLTVPQTTDSLIVRRLGLLAALLGGCAEDNMSDQPRYDPLQGSRLFGDGRSSRPPVPGTIHRAEELDAVLNTGLVNGQLTDTVPVAVTQEFLHRGQQRFDIMCSPCHSVLGDGDGMIVRRGYQRPASLHDERLRQAPVGYFFDVMTRGYGAMPRFSPQLPARDRWAVAAYIRVLQYSQHAALADVPKEMQQRLETAP